MVVAEALGADEARASMGGDRNAVLIGMAGGFTDRMIRRTRDPETDRLLEPNDFLFTNVVRCRPPDNALVGMPWEKGAIAQCSPYLEGLIAERKPRAILALGDTALQWFTGQRGITSLRGYVFPTRFGPVVPTYHPAFLLRGKQTLASVWRMDLLKALYVSRHGLPKSAPRVTHLDPPYPLWARWVETYLRDHSGEMLSFDIETPYASLKDSAIDVEDLTEEDDASYTIIRISFAYSETEAISIPWSPPYIEGIKRLLASPGPKLAWNKFFDISRVTANGAPVNGRTYDGMEAWHFLEPGLPMGLKHVATYYLPDLGAWKLEAHKQPAWYNAIDSIAALVCFNRVKERLTKENRWSVYERHFVDLGVVLKKMTERGINVDREKRTAAREDFERRRATEVERLQVLVPMECLPIEKVYKKSGEEGKEWLMKRGSWVEGMMIEIPRLESPPRVKKAKPPTGTGSRKSKKQAPPSEDLSSLVTSSRDGITSEGMEDSVGGSIMGTTPPPKRKRGRPRKTSSPPATSAGESSSQ